MTQVSANVLIESKSMRESCIDRTDVLEKVKKLPLLPDNTNVSVEMTATYYEVSRKAINSCILDNRKELESDGLKVLKGDELISLKEMGVIGKNTSSFTIIPRRALLRIGMLLRDSAVAQMVRTYLLDNEKEYRSHFDNPTLLEIQKQRAEAMIKNANTRQAKLLFDTVHKFGDRLPDVTLESLIAAGTKTLTGQDLIPQRNVGQKFYTCEEIAKKIGMLSKNGKPHNQAVAALIKHIGFSDDEVTTVVESTGPWQGTTDKYAESVLRRVEQKVQELGYPKVLNLGKSFNVFWAHQSA